MPGARRWQLIFEGVNPMAQRMRGTGAVDLVVCVAVLVVILLVAVLVVILVVVVVDDDDDDDDDDDVDDDDYSILEDTGSCCERGVFKHHGKYVYIIHSFCLVRIATDLNWIDSSLVFVGASVISSNRAKERRRSKSILQ